MTDPCPACKGYPCRGSHMDCKLELYAAHRGLTVEQLGHQSLFEERRLQAWAKRVSLPPMGEVRKLGSFSTDDDQ